MSTTQLILAFAIVFVVGYIVGVLHVYIGTKPAALMRRPSNVSDEQWQRAVKNVRVAAANAARSAGANGGNVQQWGDEERRNINSNLG